MKTSIFGVFRTKTYPNSKNRPLFGHEIRNLFDKYSLHMSQMKLQPKLSKKDLQITAKRYRRDAIRLMTA